MYKLQCDIFLNNPQVTSCNATYFIHTKNKCPNCTSVTTELPYIFSSHSGLVILALRLELVIAYQVSEVYSSASVTV